MAEQTRCWPLDRLTERFEPAAVEFVAPVHAPASRGDATTVCVLVRPSAVAGEAAVSVVRRDDERDVELLRREGAIAEVVIDAAWTAWHGRIEVLPGSTEDAPMLDVTGDGRANVLVRARPGMDCCERWLVLELGHEVRVLFDDLAQPEGDRSTRSVARELLDATGDGWPEIMTTDAFAWPAACAGATGTPPQVITAFGFDRRLRAFTPIAPRDLSGHDPALRAALQRLIGAPADATPLERSAWLLPEFWFDGTVESPGSWCEVLPLVTALLAAGRERDAWAAFDTWYRADDHAQVKAWLQGAWWWAAPWRWERGLDTFAGEWLGELATFVADPSGGLELLGGGRPVDVTVWGEGAVGERVGELRALGRDGDASGPSCPLLRGLDRRDGFALIDGCDPARRYVLRPVASGSALWLEVRRTPHDPSLAEGAHLVRAHDARGTILGSGDALAVSERLLASSCSGLRLARNEVFARRGWTFAAGGLADAFASERWYVPAGDATNRDDVNAEIAATLSDPEFATVQLIVALERARGCEHATFEMADLVAAAEEHLRLRAPELTDTLAREATAWETYLAACADRGGRAAAACREAVLVERVWRMQSAFLEVMP